MAQDVLTDLTDLEVYRALLEPRGVRGLVVDCDDCHEAHFFGWDLLRSNLRHLLDEGQTRVHEPAFSPDPADYVTWDYARGFADVAAEHGVQDSVTPDAGPPVAEEPDRGRGEIKEVVAVEKDDEVVLRAMPLRERPPAHGPQCSPSERPQPRRLNHPGRLHAVRRSRTHAR